MGVIYLLEAPYKCYKCIYEMQMDPIPFGGSNLGLDFAKSHANGYYVIVIQ